MNAYEREHRQLVRALAPECTVLLRSNGDFPLAEAGPIALYGSGARRTLMGGTGSGEVNTRELITAEQGLTAAGFTVTTKAWLDGYEAVREQARKRFIEEMHVKAKQAHQPVAYFAMGAVMPEPEYELPLDGAGDTAVYVLSRICGEGSDREAKAGDILLSETELRDIRRLSQKYQRFLLVLNVGGPVDLSPLDGVENILILSQLGMDTGNVLADLILGRAYPSGRLTTTWASWEDYCDLGEFGDREDTRYREGIYVGYRYFDTVGKKASFPFGFGLNYTEFSLTPVGISADGEEITVRALVKNTGNRPGRETAQLYVSVPGRTLDAPYQMLAAWAKTEELAAGECQELAIRFRLSELASYDAANARCLLEQGDYVLRLGKNSADTAVCGVVRLDADAVTRRVKNCLGQPDFRDWRPEKKPETAAPEETTVLDVAASSIPTQTVNYDRTATVDPVVQQIPEALLPYANIGLFSGGMTSMIGNAGRAVAGAAGETTRKLKEYGFEPLVMADGPAGLRLSPEYTLDSKGAHSLDGGLPQSILEYLTPMERRFMSLLMGKKPKKNAIVHEQYATAIPIGTAIAQSWNPQLAERLGDLVGREMERFGVQLWLAPALNIHRSIRCGRNFEYYSEDPLISGRFAAAITRGVQKHPGCAVTIKHYAANNQELNRSNNNSLVSERAMREIYLRGFEICVRESQPLALMTSYNLLNGVHTSEHRGLIEDILRSEFGFSGIVMTDWVTGRGVLSKNEKYAPPRASQIAAAGGDLCMPGETVDYKDLTAALKDGTLPRAQLEQNATRLLQLIRKLR